MSDGVAGTINFFLGILEIFLFYWALSVIVPLTPLYLENPWHYVALGVLLQSVKTASVTWLGKRPT